MRTLSYHDVLTVSGATFAIAIGDATASVNGDTCIEALCINGEKVLPLETSQLILGLGLGLSLGLTYLYVFGA